MQIFSFLRWLNWLECSFMVLSVFQMRPQKPTPNLIPVCDRSFEPHLFFLAEQLATVCSFWNVCSELSADFLLGCISVMMCVVICKVLLDPSTWKVLNKHFINAVLMLKSHFWGRGGWQKTAGIFLRLLGCTTKNFSWVPLAVIKTCCSHVSTSW